MFSSPSGLDRLDLLGLRTLNRLNARRGEACLRKLDTSCLAPTIIYRGHFPAACCENVHQNPSRRVKSCNAPLLAAGIRISRILALLNKAFNCLKGNLQVNTVFQHAHKP